MNKKTSEKVMIVKCRMQCIILNNLRLFDKPFFLVVDAKDAF